MKRSLYKTSVILAPIAILISAVLAGKFPLSTLSYFKKASSVNNLNFQNITSSNFKEACFPNPQKFNEDLGVKQENIGYQNNKFGLYIYAETDFVEYAGDLVNSNGGDWGYVLIPVNVKDYDTDKWQKIFELLNSKHLIPIIQLWDLTKREQEEQIIQSAYFLNSLPWPIKNRYVSVYNEVNDSNFWRNKADPVSYSEILDATITAFKKVSPDFFMLNGAFNASARSVGGYIDEEEFLLAMERATPGIFKRLDGWASHPYPQPEFRGSPYNSGRDSIRAYEWELDLLKRHFGVENLPVFITETGWAHREGEDEDINYLSEDIIAEYYKIAFEKVWLLDPRVVAVTPFTIRYPHPDDHFSWLREDDRPYIQYKVVQSMEKTAGKPPFVTERETVCP